MPSVLYAEWLLFQKSDFFQKLFIAKCFQGRIQVTTKFSQKNSKYFHFRHQWVKFSFRIWQSSYSSSSFSFHGKTTVALYFRWIHSGLGVLRVSSFLVVALKSCVDNFLLVLTLLRKISITLYRIQGHHNTTRVRVEPHTFRFCDLDGRC